MTLTILMYRPYHSRIHAYVYDAAGIGKNLLAGRSLTDETHATQAVRDLLRAKYPGVELAFEYREGEPYCDLKYRLPNGKVVVVK